MVASKAASQSAKRKKTEDMPDSPPKRVTRARAKASDDLESKTKVTKIVTASVRVAVQNKRPVKPVKASKRNTKPVDHKAEAAAPTGSEEPAAKETIQTKTRSKKTEEKVTKKPAEKNGAAPSTRRIAKPLAEMEVHVEAPKTRGRPKKVLTTTVSSSSDAQQVAKPEPASRTARSRAAVTAAKNNPIPSVVAAPARKRVKFQDESEKEKENIPQPRNLKDSVPSKTGLKAKPVRKPAASKAATRSKKAQDEQKKSDNGVELEEVRPLSPKKVKQIAKSCSMGSEDELCQERTPVRAMSKSPMKPPVSAFRDMDKSASKLRFDDAEMPSNLTKSSTFTILTSPARRPPPSPFKDSLRHSPKRVNLGESMAPVSKNLQSPTKTILLRSPAKRPLSPLKLMAAGASQGSNAEVASNHSGETSAESTQLNPSVLSPTKAITSPLRAASSPENPSKGLTPTMADQGVELVAQAPAPLTAIKLPEPNMSGSLSPGEVSPAKSATATEITETESSSPQPPKTIIAEPAGRRTTTPEIERKELTTANTAVLSTTPPEPAPLFVAPVFSFGTTPRVSAEEPESEDELVSSRDTQIAGTVLRTMPSALQSKITQGGFEWSPIPNDNAQPFSLTPLAMQFGDWVASSPENTVSAEPLERKRGIFSPLVQTFCGQDVQESGKEISECTENGVLGSPFKPSFFEDCFYSDIIPDQGPSSIGQSPASEMMDEKPDITDNSLSLSQSFEEYGDENVIPVDHLEGAERRSDGDNPGLTCTPATVFASFPREIHTVSKVPLKPAGDDSPTKIPKKRSRSLATCHQTHNGIEIASASSRVFDHNLINQQQASTCPSNALESTKASFSEDNTNNKTPTKPAIDQPRTPGSFSCFSSFSSYSGTPGRTVRKSLNSNILKGAVVYVDVHTSEGADASGIFLDLLTQMGARCVKKWNWNPSRAGSGAGAGAGGTSHAHTHHDDRAGASGEDEDEDSPGNNNNNKIGITHVIYKDGGKRTLEKVREAKGVVLCVGVGWVLEYVFSLSLTPH